MAKSHTNLLIILLGLVVGSGFLILGLAGCQPADTPTLENTPTMPAGLDGAPMVFVPAGPFLMGSEILPNESPEHTATLDGFWVDIYEVTNSRYQLCVASGACRPPASNSSNTYPTYYGDPAFDNFPVHLVAWEDAVHYCRWAGKRLPTEAEWEKAARGVDGRRFPWGNEWDMNRAHSNLSGLLDTVEVGSFPGGASPYGALDMAGNLWEWVADWYSEDYFAVSPAENPTGPEEGRTKVVKGGGYGVYDAGMRASVRRGDVLPEERYSFLGFRCVSG